MYELSRLDNGLMLATAEMPQRASVSVGLWVAVGGRHEPAPLNGVCHFIEHMLFKGTRHRSAREISQAVESLGGYLNAFTSEEHTCFYARGARKHLPTLLEVLIDMFLNSVFDPDEFEKERRVIQEEVAMYLDQPQQHVQELLNEAVWPDHPLGRPLTGTLESVAALQRPQLIEFMGTHYTSSNTLLVAAGPLSHTAWRRAVRPWLDHLPRGSARPPMAPAPPPATSPRWRFFTKDTSQAQLALGVLIGSRHDPRRFPMRLLNVMLGENMSSRLFQTLREDRGLVYSVHSSLSFFEDTGLLVISAGLDPENLESVLKLILAELRACRDRAPSARELQEACDYLVGQMELSLESTENQMMWLGEHILGYHRITVPSVIKQRLRRVRPADVQQAARHFLRPEHVSLAVVGPVKPPAHLAKWLDF